MIKRINILFTFSVILLTLNFSSSSVLANNIEVAIQSYNNKDYSRAASEFYEVVQNDPDDRTRDRAQIYFAQVLEKMNFLIPSLFYYTDIFRIGPDHRYYLTSIDRLLSIQKKLHDPIFIPSIINDNLNPEGFSQLEPERIAQVNYIIGSLSLSQGKLQDSSSFLEYIPEQSVFYAHASYLRGIIAIRNKQPKKAIEYFKIILELIPENAIDKEEIHIRNIALLGVARTLYAEKEYLESNKYYEKVPRFTTEWFDAMYESAWGYFQEAGVSTNNDSRQLKYGRSLGQLESVKLPYFNKRHIPEAYVIAATIYFINCQWDRVSHEVKIYKQVYEPMSAELESYLSKKRPLAEYYNDIAKDGNKVFSIEIARDVRRLKRFKDYHYMISHMKWEKEQIKKNQNWIRADLADSIVEIIDEQLKELLPAVGNWSKHILQHKLESLRNFQSQINILDFELADAERKWLEKGKEILIGKRKRITRPDVPNEKWEHWSFRTEYWKDEIGYIHHSLASECIDDLR